jgi:ATP-dependent protease HslVU (ClpYQ) ATPase subunit
MEALEFVVTDEYVRSKLSAIEKDEDFSRYIL